MYWVKYLKEYCKKSEPVTVCKAFLKWLAVNDFELDAWSFFIEELCAVSDYTQTIMWRKVLSCKEDYMDASPLLINLIDEGLFIWYTFLEGEGVLNYKIVFINDFIHNEAERNSFESFLKENELY